MEGEKEKKKTDEKKVLKIIGITVIIILLIIIIVAAIVVYVAKNFVAEEKEVRSSWSVETGELLQNNEELDINVYEASVNSDLKVIQLEPIEINEEGFTYYFEDVQDRLANAITTIKEEMSDEWTAENPLAILNPFGTGSNGLYMYFETDLETSVTYTIHVDNENIEDYTATAQNVWLDDENTENNTYTTEHEFQIVGLVPGETNEVTLTITGSWGAVRQIVTFSIDMPETISGYATQLETTDGDSTEELSSGLYAMVRTNGYLGYGFFYDNSGIMRYEMVLEGLGMDRILSKDNDIVVCVSANKIARIDGLGRVIQTYELGDYELHHDINYGTDENIIVALVEESESVYLEDIVIEIDLETGEVSELINFTEFMSDYVEEYTHIIGLTDDFFWQAGYNDWIHLNTIQWLDGEDSIIVSSRETSTIIKVENVHSSPEVAYLVGDSDFWEGTSYEDLCLEQIGDFIPQYGQHTVEYDGAYIEEDGTESESKYYLLLYDNNYWALSTRYNYTPDLDDIVGTSLYGDSDDVSLVYRYLIDEEEGTYELVESFEVPYSSIVSSVNHAPNSDNYVTNSGVAMVFGEYDSEGNLIREFAYECEMQSYRVFKSDFVGFWYQ